MKIRTLPALMLALIMTLSLAIVPSAAVAEGITFSVQEAAKLNKLDKVWAVLDKAEANAIESGSDRTQVINAVYESALNHGLINPDSFSDFTKDGFFFTVDGMHCAYNYRLRNEIDRSGNKNGKITVTPSNGKKVPLRDAESPDVLLIGPYYGQDYNFTDQYRNEAASIAAATGGTVTELSGSSATGPAIVENYLDKGVVIYDSHGCQSGDSSYLCLTTNAGITSEDYSNGWAVSSGSAAYIDGRYVEHHATAELANCLVWMATCEGMKREGRGTTGTALLNAGAGVVYGYSQSVTFSGDYLYEETFWNAMKNEADPATVAEAFDLMVDTHGVYDPYGDAYPIVMSATDPFPQNPDSPQTVTSNWLLFGNPEPVELTDFSLDPFQMEVYIGRSKDISFVREPENANQYELVWISDNPSVATVTGNNRRATVTGISEGTAHITCRVMVNGEAFGAAQTAVTVSIDTTLCDALNIPGGSIQFGTGEGYCFEAVAEDDRYFAKSNNAGAGRSEAVLTATLDMRKDDTLDFEYFVSSENNYDWYTFTANGEQLQHLSGTSMTDWEKFTFTAPEAGTYNLVWSYKKDSSVNKGEDCVKLDNMDFSGGDPVALTGFSIEPTEAEVYIGRELEINFNREPFNANAYDLIWTSDNESVAAVEGTRRHASVTALNLGTANITCTVMVDGEVFGEASCAVTVVEDTSLNDALNVENGTIDFVSDEAPFGFEAVMDGDRFCGMSTNGGISDFESVMSTRLDMTAGETLDFEYFVSSEYNYDWYTFTVNGEQKQHISGEYTNWINYTFTAPSTGTYDFVWSYEKDYSRDAGQDCVKIDNVAYSGDGEEPPVTEPPVTEPPVTEPPVTEPPVTEPPVTEPPVTEPPVTEPPVTEPPVTEPPVTEPDGDFNLDGCVTVEDAVLVLQCAIGIIEPTNEQILHCDMNGDGTIDIVDAIAILNIALEL